MEPDVIRMYSSSPPPMEDGVDEEDDEFGDFDAFSGVPNSVSFSEFETQTTFNQTQALNATSPPELTHSRALISANGTDLSGNNVSKANGHLGRTEKSVKELSGSNLDLQTDKETLTNGFQGSPSSQKSAHFLQENEEEFADFAAFSANSEGEETLDVEKLSDCVKSLREFADIEGHEATETENAETNRTEPEFANFNAFSGGEECTLENNFTRTGSEMVESVPKDEDEFVSFSEKETQNEDCSSQNGITFEVSGSVCSSDFEPPSELDCVESVENIENAENVENRLVLNGTSEKDESKDVAESDGKSSETETETSFGRPLSTEALEEFGDMSTTGSVPSPPLQEENATPTGDDEEDFGDFGDCFNGQEFANFEQSKPQNEDDNDDDFGDFNSPKFKEEKEEAFTEFPASESFGNFSSAAEKSDAGWSAFGNENMETMTREEEGDESWAAFSSEETKEEPNRTEKSLVLLADRLEKLFCSSFPEVDSALVQDQVLSLKLLLEPTDDTRPTEQSHRAVCVRVWAQLLDIHEAFGLRHQWGGSHCNKALLCSLGIDTRNILFTGQKKQPVIVPMYAAGLGMLEPTKEPVKPVSAAEMIASIGQNPSCSSDAVQEALPPVQFDWSSSGLTNPLDASGGSSLLNLDFFGPVEDSESGSASIPGVDPELIELTTVKLDSNRVTDAFARLMSTVQSTSTSTRKPRREENLSDEALKVICAFPDLTFMTAKVLMFPATLTPHGAESGPESGPGPEPGPGPGPGPEPEPGPGPD